MQILFGILFLITFFDARSLEFLLEPNDLLVFKITFYCKNHYSSLIAKDGIGFLNIILTPFSKHPITNVLSLEKIYIINIVFFVDLYYFKLLIK